MRSRNAPIAVRPSTPGQADVEHDGVERAAGGDLQALLDRGGDLDVVPLVAERLAERPADARLVVDDQDAAHAAPRGVSARMRQGEAEAGLPVRAGPGQPPAVVGRHAMRQRQAEADPLGLARDERLAQRIGQLGRRPRARVGHLDGHLLADRPSPRAGPCRPAPPPRWRSRSGSRARPGRPTGRRRPRAVRPPARCERATRACWHAGSTRKATSARSWPRSQASAGRRSTLPSESRPLTCSSVIASCRRATLRLWSPAGAGCRRAWSCTLIRAPVSAFRS